MGHQHQHHHHHLHHHQHNRHHLHSRFVIISIILLLLIIIITIIMIMISSLSIQHRCFCDARIVSPRASTCFSSRRFRRHASIMRKSQLLSVIVCCIVMRPRRSSGRRFKVAAHMFFIVGCTARATVSSLCMMLVPEHCSSIPCRRPRR